MNNRDENMQIIFDYSGMMAENIGSMGITTAEIESLKEMSMLAAKRMDEKRKTNMLWRELPYEQRADLERIKAIAEKINKEYESFVVLGIGGSALGPIAVQNALNHPHYNELPKDKRGVKFYVEDNVDPERMAALLDVIDPKTTMFNVITKSGSTSETMSQLMIITGILKEALGDDYAKNIIATTDKSKGNLIVIAKRLGIETLIIPDGVGGRFSELCPVGLLPAAVCGIDIERLLDGAEYMDNVCKNNDFLATPAYAMAVMSYAAMKKGCNISVMMPYADSLKYIADWYAQLWAESLGKRFDVNGNEVYTGQTPVKSLGVTDQHSQVQLYTEGPFDKVITFISVDKYRAEVKIPSEYDDIEGVAFLGGHTLNELITAEERATEYAVMKSGHMCNAIRLPEVNEFVIGELLYMLEVATAFAGELLNIDAFDQPGVEEGKAATYALLGKKGYDEKRIELETNTSKKTLYESRGEIK